MIPTSLQMVIETPWAFWNGQFKQAFELIPLHANASRPHQTIV
jgi:hypothetical protein